MKKPRYAMFGTFPSVLFVFCAAGAAQHLAAQSHPSGDSPGQKVFRAGPGVTAPELIAPEIPIERIHHCNKLDGEPVIELVVDANGNPSAPLVTHPADGNLNEAALALVAKDRFKPGTHDGVPAAVSIQIKVELKTCGRYAPQGSGLFILASLRAKPVQKVAVSPPISPEIAKALGETTARTPVAHTGRLNEHTGPVIAPVPLNAVVAHYTDSARKARITGVCVVRVIVDAYGKPQQPRIIKSLDPGLDQEAMKAVMHYRFKPAMRDGLPVPVQITVAIDFKIR